MKSKVCKRVINTLFLISTVVLLSLAGAYVIKPALSRAPAGNTPAATPAATPAPTPGSLAGKRIVADAGHGGFDGGATGVNGTVEAGVNLEITLCLKAELESLGAEVVLTRADDGALGGTKRADMAERRRIMNDGADIVISVHQNKFSDSSVSGPMVFYMQGSQTSAELAGYVINSVCDATGRNRRAANPADYFVLRECSAPSVLVECGFLSNPSDEALLCEPAHQSALARGIAEGVAEWVRAQGAASPCQ